MTFITVTEVRNVCGAPSNLVSDTKMEQYISTVEADMAKCLNTAFTPTERIDILNGNYKSIIFTDKNPLLSVRQLTVNEDITVTPEYVKWDKSSGKITLTSSAEASVFTLGVQNTYIKYLFGHVVESSTRTTSTAAVEVGTSVSVTVSSISGFSDDDWVEIYGMDGNREVAQISGDPSGSTIVLDQLVKDHESGSVVVKLEIPEYIKDYMLVEAGICAGINAIGATYTFNASYSLGELQVTKGVPYTHWRESVQRLISQREVYKQNIKPRPAIR